MRGGFIDQTKGELLTLHHGAQHARAFPFFRSIPRQVCSCLLGLWLVINGAASKKEEGTQKKQTIPQSLDK